MQKSENKGRNASKTNTFKLHLFRGRFLQQIGENFGVHKQSTGSKNEDSNIAISATNSNLKLREICSS
jgi:hypothetical protein